MSIPSYSGQIPRLDDPEGFPADADQFLPWLVSAFAALSQLAIIGDGTTRFVQSSPSDTTAGRLLTPGAFGWGTSGVGVDLISDLNTLQVSGVWRYSGATGAPSFAPAGVVLHLNRLSFGASGHSATQIAVGLNGETSARSRNTGAWAPWRRLDVEYGANGNGSYFRFNDSIQICWHSLTSSSSSAVVWTYPAAFASVLATFANPLAPGAPRIGNIENRFLTTADVSVWTTAGARAVQTVSLLAIGTY